MNPGLAGKAGQGRLTDHRDLFMSPCRIESESESASARGRARWRSFAGLQWDGTCGEPGKHSGWLVGGVSRHESGTAALLRRVPCLTDHTCTCTMRTNPPIVTPYCVLGIEYPSPDPDRRCTVECLETAPNTHCEYAVARRRNMVCRSARCAICRPRQGTYRPTRHVTDNPQRHSSVVSQEIARA